MFTSDSNLLDDVQTWYEVIWNEAIPVQRKGTAGGRRKLEKASRLSPGAGCSRRLVTQLATVFRDREIYLAIYWEHASKRAHQTFTDVQRDLELADDVMRRGL
nr:hypothetical protein [Pseudomonas cichorii]